MKAHLVLVAACFLSSGNIDNDCSRVKNGRFRLVDATTGTTLIFRTGNKQIEEGQNDGVKVMAEVRRLDECTYQLLHPKVIEGQPDFPIEPGLVVTTRILSVNNESYKVQVTTNLCDVVLEKDIEIIEAEFPEKRFK